MASTHEPQFESPSFWERLKGMLGVDFYRLFHTPMFYIFLGIAAIIPAMIRSKFSRWQGFVLLAIYAVYIIITCFLI